MFCIKGKKGITWETLLRIIIMVVSLIVLLSIVIILSINLISGANKYVCWTSVLIKDVISSQPFVPYELVGCMNKAKIKDKEDEKIEKAIAEEMKDCWWKVHEGRIDILGKWALPDGKLHCLPCANIKFEHDIGIISMRDFTSYLEKNYVNSKISYAQYLQSGKGISSDIDTSKSYYLLLGVAKELTWNGWYKTLTEFAKGALVGTGGVTVLKTLIPIKLPSKVSMPLTLGAILGSGAVAGFWANERNSYAMLLIQEGGYMEEGKYIGEFCTGGMISTYETP